MNYQEALDWIHGKLKFGIKPGLERMAWMLEELGNPQEKLAAVHVVGTNGKGSVTSYLQHIFSLAGYEVGTFTSPYIVDFRERISLNGQMISEKDFLELVERVRPVVERLSVETDLEPATEFEVITVLMFEYFGHMHPVDIAIIEAGMGGLYDSTNVFKALAVLCPSIGLDHQNVLGETYAEIAAQKVGVLKEKVPFIFATNRADVRQVFADKAKSCQSPLYEFGKDFLVKENENGFDYLGHETLEQVELAMPGKHQISNASLAITAAFMLRNRYPKVTKGIIKVALAQTHWVGRTELVFPNVMIDGAHNNESVQALVNVMQKYKDKHLHILFAAIDTKPIDSMLDLLSQLADVDVTTFVYHNALPLDKYPSQYHKVAKWQDWIDQIDFGSQEDFYLITGSLYFISQVRPVLLSRQQN
ncbi:bifunctional folylpolyglutamate synthase/dihydrofolate synthase [Streptococcus vicugnae]|uniref:tetrahydrofolate synthase n=1 Tax=Streptococcus vicugnae TaxID=2740579 RepID=A0A4R5G581_9STRE|nr:folylpolyglutamate synthase/dihydrofolate synthase family protein [Streptococcus vicugnae]TDE73744.1 bifunctional folylpolyglutamate synthase/dihydrofolate synthase [Streptococcus vicugnae]